MNRDTRHFLYSLELLRGILAICVMAYHLTYYQKIANLVVFSYYPVYGFFVISGMSLYLAYANHLSKKKEVLQYLIRRIFRIAPLFWAAIVLSFIVVGLPSNVWERLFWNLSLLFGFNNPGMTSLITGGWSIGIEVVFYLIFPIVLTVCKFRISRLVYLAFCACCLSIWFTNSVIDSNLSRMTADLWQQYTHPIAFIGYFCVGCAFGEIYRTHHKKLKGRLFSIGLLLFSLIPFIFYLPEKSLGILTGYTGVILFLATLILVGSASILPEGNSFFQLFARQLGRLSYSIYLTHPIVYAVIRKAEHWSPFVIISITTVVTIILSYIVYFILENPFRRLGRSLFNN